MKKKIYSVALALVAGVGFTSCDDYLDAENKSSGGDTADDYFSTSAGQLAYRNYALSLLNPIVDDTYITMYDNATDIYWPNRNSPDEFDLYTLVADNSTCASFYTACYALIQAANGVLYYGGYDMDAKFLRCVGYYYLTQQMGSVPYITTYINDASRSYPRTALQEIYDGCLADLDEVIASSDVASTSTHDGTINKQAANALAAKFALAAGWDLNTTTTSASAGTYSVSSTTYFTRAAKYAEAALSGVTLYSNFADKWAQSNDETNQEEFFSAEYDRTSYATVASTAGAGHSLQNDYASYYGTGATNGSKQGTSLRGMSIKSLFLFEEEDTRYDATFAKYHVNYDGTNWPGTGYYARYQSGFDFDNCQLFCYFAPWYTDDFETFLSDNKDRFVQGSCVNTPKAVLLGNPSTVYSFNEDGSVKSSTSYSYAYNGGILSLTEGGDCVCKWDDSETAQTETKDNSFRDIQFLHASETMLTAAEAYLMAGDESSALSKVNDLRTRAGLSTLSSFSAYDPSYLDEASIDAGFTATALDVILDERARELYGEPGRWMDLRRTKQLERYYTYFFLPYDRIQSSARDDVKWLRPIPTDEINSNEGISESDQNAGY